MQALCRHWLCVSILLLVKKNGLKFLYAHKHTEQLYYFFVCFVFWLIPHKIPLQLLIWEFWQEPRALIGANWTITEKLGIELEPKPHRSSSAITLKLLPATFHESRGCWKLTRKHPAQASITSFSRLARNLGWNIFLLPPMFWMTGKAIRLHLIFSLLGKA